jgi:hypothetical protein
VNYSFCPHSVALGSIQLQTEVRTKEFSWGKLWPVHGADGSAVLIVPNVKVRMEAKHSMPPLSLHDFLWESFIFYTKLYGHCLLLNL